MFTLDIDIDLQRSAEHQALTVRPHLVGALVAGLATAASAMEIDPQIRRAFTGTIVSTYPDGRTALLWLYEGGSYRALGRRRQPSSGRWSVKGDQICMKQRKPLPVPFSYCTAIPRGENAAAKAPTGERIRIALAPDGREQAPVDGDSLTACSCYRSRRMHSGQLCARSCRWLCSGKRTSGARTA